MTTERKIILKSGAEFAIRYDSIDPEVMQFIAVADEIDMLRAAINFRDDVLNRVGCGNPACKPCVIHSPAPPPVEAIGEPVAVISERALKKLADGTARCVHAYAKAVDEDDVKLYRATPATPSSQDAPRAVPAGLSDAQRLDFMLAKSAFIVWCNRDGSIRQCQLMSQDEDEVYTVLSGIDRFFGTERAAIDAALAASAPGAPDLAQPQQGTGSGKWAPDQGEQS